MSYHVGFFMLLCMECVKPPGSFWAKCTAPWLEACGGLWLCRWNTSSCQLVMHASFIQSCGLMKLSLSIDIYSSAISDTRVGIKYQTETAEHFCERSLSVVLPYELHRQIPKKSKKFEFPLWNISYTPCCGDGKKKIKNKTWLIRL